MPKSSIAIQQTLKFSLQLGIGIDSLLVLAVVIHPDVLTLPLHLHTSLNISPHLLRPGVDLVRLAHLHIVVGI